MKRTFTDEDLEMIYRTLMPYGQDPRVERASEAVYRLITGSPDFMRLEEAINGYTAETERRGFIEGLKAGLRLGEQGEGTSKN